VEAEERQRTGIAVDYDPESVSVALQTIVDKPFTSDERLALSEWTSHTHSMDAVADRVVEVAEAVHGAGAEAVTLVNTLLGMVLDSDTGLPVLGAGGGGYSGRPVHPVAVRTVYDVHAALPDLPIVGAGGVASGWDAAELMLAGASAVQVGTATFADPAAPLRIQRELLTWCAERGVAPAELTGRAHRGGL